MILQSKQTTVAYRCPTCGKFIFGIVGIFTLSGDLIKLKCDCGGSELKIEYTGDDKLRITVPCLFCPKPHVYVLTKGAFFDREILALNCTYSGLDTCFIGDTDKVSEAAKSSDDMLLELLEDAGFDGIESFMRGRAGIDGEDNVDEDYRLDYAQIEDVVRFMLAELKDEGAIRCDCEDGADPDFEFKGDSVLIYCKKCHCEKRVPMSSTLAANAFLHIDSLDLENPEV
jgi:hypothetical protein